MSDYTVDDTMVKIIYDLSDREIYNDVRAELGIETSETIVDADPAYEWKQWSKYSGLPSPGYTMFRYFTATLQEPITWQLNSDHSAWDYDLNPYYDYEISLEDTNDANCKAVKITNTGNKGGTISFSVKYKYKTSDEVTHEEISYQTLTVRAIDETSIKKYARRVMNLTWPQGADEAEMQMIADACLARYKEPWPVLHVTIQGKNDALATQIFTREISDVISVICDKLGLASTDFFIDRISIRDSAVGIPVCTWMLTGQRDEEVVGYFVIDTDFIDGDKLIA